MTEELTDHAREVLGALPSGREAIRIIDAHAADRAALVAQLKAADSTIAAIRGYMHATLADSTFVLKGPSAQRVRDLLSNPSATETDAEVEHARAMTQARRKGGINRE